MNRIVLDLEYQPNGLTYHTCLWLVSFWAMVSDLARAAVKKLLSRKTNFRRILWEMGRNPKHFSSFFVDKFSRYNHQAKWGAAGWQSLDVFYNYFESVKPRLNGNLESRLTTFWIERMDNRQAVTNRLKIVTEILAESFDRFADQAEIRILSVASGSAQAVIQAIEKRQCLAEKIKAILVDIDPTAIANAETAVKKAGLEKNFTFISGSTKILDGLCGQLQPHIIEMVGFLDYRPKPQAEKLINRLRRCLGQDGILLTCNIAPNPEKIFLDWVLLWPMIYRTEEEFTGLLIAGGFEKEKIKILAEPHGIHNIGICQK